MLQDDCCRFSGEDLIRVAGQLHDANASAAHLLKLIREIRAAAKVEHGFDEEAALRASHQMLERALERLLEASGWNLDTLTSPDAERS